MFHVCFRLIITALECEMFTCDCCKMFHVCFRLITTALECEILRVTAVKCFTYVSRMFQTDHHGSGVRELPGAPAGGRETERQDRRPEEPEASARCRHLPDTLVHFVTTFLFKLKFFIALSFTTYQHYTIYNINNNIHIYRVMYMMMVESD